MKLAKPLLAAALTCALATTQAWAQSNNGQTQSNGQTQTPPANPQTDQNIPDAPSAVQPPPKPTLPSTEPDLSKPDLNQQGEPGENQGTSSSQPESGKQPPPMPPVQTLPPGTPVKVSPPSSTGPKNQINPAEGLYKYVVTTSFVQIPVTVKDSDGRRVEGLLPEDFTVLENGKVQKLTYFTSDPFQLSVAIVLDLGMSDVTLQKINQTYSALVGALSPYDEAALYTYSSTVSQVIDFTNRSVRLTDALNEIKVARGRSNGPPVLDDPFSTGPVVNGAPIGTGGIAPVSTPPRESHVLNDAILRAAIDLSKRPRTTRKVIFIVSDGQEMGSQARYRDVLRVLESHDIEVRAVVVGSGALPGYKQLDRFHLKLQGYGDILPKYSHATGGGDVLTELTRNAIEDAYADITSEARNQYTLGYPAKPTTGSSAYRSIEVLVHHRGLKVYAKDGYYPAPSPR